MRAIVSRRGSVRRPLGAFAALSVPANGLYLGLSPWLFYDSGKYLVAAQAIVEGRFVPEHQPIENAPGYAGLLALSMQLGALLGTGYAPILMLFQVAACVGIDLLVFLAASRLTDRRIVWFGAGLGSLASVMVKVYVATVMTEVFYLFALCGFLVVAMVALQRTSGRWLLASILLLMLAAWLRPAAAGFWIVVLLLWLAKAVREGRAAAPAAPGWRRLGAVALAAVLVAAGASRLTSPPGIGLHERLAILWRGTVELDARMYEELRRTERFAAYRRDFDAWIESEVVPPGAELEPLWAEGGAGAFFANARGNEQTPRWWKVPPWVLTTRRGQSLPEALRWQTDTALGLIAANPGLYADIVLRTWWQTTLRRPVGSQLAERAAARSLARGGANALTPVALAVVRAANRLYAWLYPAEGALWARPASLWTLLLLSGTALGFLHYRRWEYALLVSLVAYHLLVIPVLGGSQARYRFPLEVFAGCFAFGALLAIARPRRGPDREPGAGGAPG